MWKFLFLLRDPGAGENGGGEGAPGTSDESKALEQALLDEGGAPNADDKDKETKDVKAGAGDQGGDKGKGPGAGKSITDEDPEVEIENKDDKGVITKNKIKMSELKAGYLRQQDYTTKSQRVAEVEKNQKDLITTIEAIRANPNLSKLFIGLIEKSIGKEGYNQAFIDKTLQSLQDVQPDKGDDKQDLKDKQEDIEDLLKEVDADSPIAKALRQTYAMNKKLMADLKGLSDKVGTTTKAVEDRQTQEHEAQYQKLVTDAGKMMNDHLDGMIDPAKGNLDFFTDGEKQEWRYKVVAFLRDNPVEYKDEKEFLGRIEQVGKALHNHMVKYREGIIARQLENKNKKPIEKKDETQSQEAMTLEQELEKELLALEGGGAAQT